MARIAIVTGPPRVSGWPWPARWPPGATRSSWPTLTATARNAPPASLPGTATPATVDVRDAAAVPGPGRRHPRHVRPPGRDGEQRRHRRRRRGLLLAHWDRVIDVNLRGVVHGVHAAYTVMIAQRSGHIVNTASLAGLLPAPGLTPYAMKRHAIVAGVPQLRSALAGEYGV